MATEVPTPTSTPISEDCPICLIKIPSANEDRHIFPCRHAVCEKHLLDLALNGGGQDSSKKEIYVACPECREKHVVRSNSVLLDANRANLDLVYRFLLRHPNDEGGSVLRDANSPRGYSAPRLRTRLDEFSSFVLFCCWVYVLRDDLPPGHLRRLGKHLAVMLTMLFFFFNSWLLGLYSTEWLYLFLFGLGVLSCLRMFLSFFDLGEKTLFRVSLVLGFVCMLAFRYFCTGTSMQTASFWIWTFLLSTVFVRGFLWRGSADLR